MNRLLPILGGLVVVATLTVLALRDQEGATAPMGRDATAEMAAELGRLRVLLERIAATLERTPPAAGAAPFAPDGADAERALADEEIVAALTELRQAVDDQGRTMREALARGSAALATDLYRTVQRRETADVAALAAVRQRFMTDDDEVQRAFRFMPLVELLSRFGPPDNVLAWSDGPGFSLRYEVAEGSLISFDIREGFVIRVGG